MAKLPDFLVHDSEDVVGVAVVEGIKRGQTLTGWVMDRNKTIRIKCVKAIPLGHKVALKSLKGGTTVLKYGANGTWIDHSVSRVIEIEAL